MDKSLIEKYKAEMLRMQSRAKIVPAVSPMPEMPTPPSPQEVVEPINENKAGGLIAIVSTLRNLYPVPRARVTVFTGNLGDMTVIDTAFTDESGRTKTFQLETPSKEISLQSNSSSLPYASYNMLVQADGYIDNVHLNIPVFRGVTSLQRSDMMLYETAGEDKGPQILTSPKNLLCKEEQYCRTKFYRLFPKP